MTTTDLKDDVEIRSLDSVIPYGENPKEHPTEQVDKIASSIQRFGWDQPIVVDAEGTIIKGHGRYQAAQKLGLDEVPIIEQADLSEAQARAARIADNKTAESEWDDDLLAVELELLEDSDVPAEASGFDDPDDIFVDDNADVPTLDEDETNIDGIEDLDILNLYAGIGGNRKLWGDGANVTAVEWDETIAQAYQEFNPNDKVVVADAHEYLLEHFGEFDFIWSSPPCPTHSKMQRTFVNSDAPQNKNREAVYPDMSLYQQIILLDNFFDGKYAVENVQSYYDPLIEPTEVGRHYIWSNFEVTDVKTPHVDIQGKTERYEKMYDFDVSDYSFDKPTEQVLRNCVHPKIGKTIIEIAVKDMKSS